MKRKYSIGLLLLLLCLAMNAFHASAADDRLGTVVDGSLLTDGTEAEGVSYPKARGSYLSTGRGSLSVAGYRKLTMAGTTSCYRTVSAVKVTLYLQRLEGNSWVTVNVLGPKTKYNDYYVSNSNTYSVTGGYYYRVYGGHTAIQGGSSEAITSCSNGIWIS